jgi:hypothetical protein
MAARSARSEIQSRAIEHWDPLCRPGRLKMTVTLGREAPSASVTGRIPPPHATPRDIGIHRSTDYDKHATIAHPEQGSLVAGTMCIPMSHPLLATSVPSDVLRLTSHGAWGS